MQGNDSVDGGAPFSSLWQPVINSCDYLRTVAHKASTSGLPLDREDMVQAQMAALYLRHALLQLASSHNNPQASAMSYLRGSYSRPPSSSSSSCVLSSSPARATATQSTGGSTQKMVAESPSTEEEKEEGEDTEVIEAENISPWNCFHKKDHENIQTAKQTKASNANDKTSKALSVMTTFRPYQCAWCHEVSTPEWRKGPKKERLCNRCGLKWRRVVKRQQRKQRCRLRESTIKQTRTAPPSRLKEQEEGQKQEVEEEGKEREWAAIRSKSSIRAILN
ncbi:Zinc finger domain-containing protein, GATA-type [Balamuthia mandrillaris]